MVTELVVIALPAWFITKYRISTWKKITVMFSFAFRIGVALLFVGYTVSYLDFMRHGQQSIGLAPTVAWQESLLGASLLSASIPCLRSFLGSFMSRGILV